MRGSDLSIMVVCFKMTNNCLNDNTFISFQFALNILQTPCLKLHFLCSGQCICYPSCQSCRHPLPSVESIFQHDEQESQAIRTLKHDSPYVI